MRQSSKQLRLLLLFFLFSSVLGGVRIRWIQKAVSSKAIVKYIEPDESNTRGIDGYPVVEYKVDGYVVTSRGTANLPVRPDQILNVLVNPDDVHDWKINEPYWLWFDI